MRPGVKLTNILYQIGMLPIGSIAKLFGIRSFFEVDLFYHGCGCVVKITNKRPYRLMPIVVEAVIPCNKKTCSLIDSQDLNYEYLVKKIK